MPIDPQYWQAIDESARNGELSENEEKHEVSAVELEMPTVFENLGESDVWICDTGASSHLTKDKKDAVHEKKSGSPSLGQAGKAVKATSTIDLPGQFCAKDGSLGLKATLTDVNYNKSLNFNLMSLSRLLQNGWSITQGDATCITIKSESGAVINFDIVVPTPRGAIYATRFICNIELLVVSTKTKTQITLDKAHGLLGHCNMLESPAS